MKSNRMDRNISLTQEYTTVPSGFSKEEEEVKQYGRETSNTRKENAPVPNGSGMSEEDEVKQDCVPRDDSEWDLHGDMTACVIECHEVV